MVLSKHLEFEKKKCIPELKTTIPTKIQRKGAEPDIKSWKLEQQGDKLKLGLNWRS